jgi:hypothetical protein
MGSGVGGWHFFSLGQFLNKPQNRLFFWWIIPPLRLFPCVLKVGPLWDREYEDEQVEVDKQREEESKANGGKEIWGTGGNNRVVVKFECKREGIQKY